ncbi:MAG: 4Fe-4S binding protein [Oscillospiraceae bacterium]|nr:4Fe-4S binding protein [Oscillospiraceae bacterium]
MALIEVDESKCVGCNACIRACPAPEANKTFITEDRRSITQVNSERCIACGECVRACRHGARNFNDDLEKFLNDCKTSRKVMVVAPSIKTAFPRKWRNILNWFRSHGVAAIYDVSLGADICSWAHLKFIEDHPDEKIITQPCAAIVNYVKKYSVNLVDSLSPIHSPIACEAIYLRDYLNVREDIAAFTPCIAKKDEFTEIGVVKYNITYKKVQDYFEKNNIKIPEENFEYTYNFDDQQGTLGGIYPRPGGLRDNLWFKDPDLNITNSEGVNKVYRELDMYSQIDPNHRPDVFDVLSCEFGCNTGPASGDNTSIFEIMSIMRDVEAEAKKDRREGKARNIFGSERDKLYKKFDDTLDLSKFARSYDKPKKTSYTPKDSDLDPVFVSMGKITDADRHFDCHACGYNSCRDMAIAIYRGLNVPENCIVHAKTALSKRYGDVENVSKGVSDFANKLTADIENIYASLLSIDEKNKQGFKYTDVVDSLLRQVIDTYKDEKSLDSDDVKELILVLDRMQDSIKIMNNVTAETTTNSAAIREAMEEVANATMELSRMVNEMVDTFGKA